MEKIGKICILDDDAVLTDWFVRSFSERGYEIFATSNVYKFLKYAREIFPDLLITNMQMAEIRSMDVLDVIAADEVLKNIPLAMFGIAAESLQERHAGISHYLFKPVSLKKISDVFEPYCLGRKKHDLLLIDDYNPLPGSAADVLRRQNLTFFETHNLCAAQKYLSKNFPRGVCVCLPSEECRKAEAELHYEKIFYVENPARLENIATLLQ